MIERVLAATLSFGACLATAQELATTPSHDGAVIFRADAAVLDVDLGSESPVVKPGVAHLVGDRRSLGFSAGPRRFPAGEQVAPEFLALSGVSMADGRPRSEAYGFIVFAQRQSQGVLQTVESKGVRLLGFFPHNAQKAAFSLESIPALVGDSSLSWFGPARPIDKAAPQLAEYIAEVPSGKPLEVFISLFESDENDATVREGGVTAVGWNADSGAFQGPNESKRGEVVASRGWQQRALERLGVNITGYEPAAVAFHARVPVAVLGEVLSLDFVLAVEPATRPTPGHEESMPLIHADATRGTWGGQFSNAVTVGVLDTGLRATHEAIAGHFLWGWDLTSANNPWIDQCNGGQGHGTHVCGTIFGNPPGANERRRGVAPYLGSAPTIRLRSVRLFGSGCFIAPGTYDSWFSPMRGSVDDGTGAISPPPVVVNHSWGSGPATPAWKGTEVGPRTIDAEVWNQNQVQVFITHNFGPSPGSVSPEATAKNSLVVGSVIDCYEVDPSVTGIYPHRLWTGAQASGQGPCGDGRWKPNVVAPGHWVTSAGANTNVSYLQYNGTSMAAPHLTGVVAQLADHYPELRFAPQRMAAHVMASAMPFEDQAFSYPAPPTANQYGAGRVEALRAHGLETGTIMESWSVSLNAGQGATGDFTVPPGATRVFVVSHWIEPAASAGAAMALVNDLDLHLDIAPFGAGTNTGEWTSNSGVNNTEAWTLLAPTAGNYRWKLHPFATATASRAAVVVLIQQADTSPIASLELQVSDAFVKPNEVTTIHAEVGSVGGILSAAYLDTVTSTNATKNNTRTILRDGVVTNLTANFTAAAGQGGLDILLGNIAGGTSRIGSYDVRWLTQGVKTWSSQVISENATTVADSLTVTVDGTPPPAPSTVGSSTHVPGVWSNQPSITFDWSQTPDALSGVVGNSISLGTSPTTPDGIADLGVVTSFATTLAPEQQGAIVFSVLAIDACGNGSAVANNPTPFLIDFTAPTGVSLSIELGETQTSSSSVSLAIQASDAISGVSEMRFRNDGGAFSPWEPFVATKVWDLESFGGWTTHGTRGVECEIRDFAENITSTSDSIYWSYPVEYGGTACAGALGSPAFTIDGVPGIGQSIVFSVNQTNATHGILYLGLSASTWGGAPLPVAIGLSGCTIDVSLDFAVYSGVLLPIPATIPSDPLFVGIPLHFQWLLTGDSSGKPVVTTKRATMTIAGT